VALCHLRSDLGRKIFDLSGDGTHLHLGIKKPRRSDELLDRHLGVIRFVIGRRRRNKENPFGLLLEFGEIQGTVIQRRWKPETEVDERLLASPVAFEHPPHLGERDMAFIDDNPEIVGKVAEKRGRRFARPAPR